MGKKHNHHDYLFKTLMSSVDIAKDFFKCYLPRSIVKRLDWKKLKLFKFNPEMKFAELGITRTADMVYTTQIDQTPGYLILHAEHQSSLDEDTYIRTEIYSRLIYLEHRKTHPKQPRPAIFSVIYFQVYLQQSLI